MNRIGKWLNVNRRAEWGLLVAILLVASLLRLWRLNSVPPGLTHDEANNVHDAAAVLDGVRPIYFPVAQGKEPLYLYSAAAAMSFLGRTPLALRLTSVIWGLSLIVFTYAWVRSAFDPVVALITAGGLAVGFWPLTTARMGLRAIALPGLLAASVTLLWMGLDLSSTTGREKVGEQHRWILFILSGLALGLCLYTYLAALLVPAVVVAFWLYLLFFHRQRWRQRWWGPLLALVVAVIVAAPLFFYLQEHPSAGIRLGQLDQPLRTALAGNLVPLFDRSWQAFKLFSFQGDTFIPYNLPGKPLFGPVLSILFYCGLLLAFVRGGQPAYALGLIWFFVGVFPAVATGAEAANLRVIAAQPVVYLFPALSLSAGGRQVIKWGLGDRDKAARIRLTLGVGAVSLFVIVMGLTVRDYFYRWVEDHDVRVHYHVDLAAVADFVEDSSAPALAISALFPGEYHDPRVVEAELSAADDRLRWFDGRQGLVLPTGTDVLYIVPDHVPVADSLLQFVGTSWDVVERVSLQPDDFVPGITIFRRGGDTLATETLAALGEELALNDVQMTPTSAVPGQMVEILSLWTVTRRFPDDRDGVLFSQVIGLDGTIVAQDDRLDVPSWNWHMGDRFIQRLLLELPADLPAGSYRLILGAYTIPDRVDAVLAGLEPDPAMPRLPARVGGEDVGDHIELPPLQVMSGE